MAKQSARYVGDRYDLQPLSARKERWHPNLPKPWTATVAPQDSSLGSPSATVAALAGGVLAPREPKVDRFTVTDSGQEQPVSELIVSITQAMVCSLVLTSGAGMSTFGPRIGVIRRCSSWSPVSAHWGHLRRSHWTTLPPKGDIDYCALPGHQRGWGSRFVEARFGVVLNAFAASGAFHAVLVTSKDLIAPSSIVTGIDTTIPAHSSNAA